MNYNYLGYYATQFIRSTGLFLSFYLAYEVYQDPLNNQDILLLSHCCAGILTLKTNTNSLREELNLPLLEEIINCQQNY